MPVRTELVNEPVSIDEVGFALYALAVVINDEAQENPTQFDISKKYQDVLAIQRIVMLLKDEKSDIGTKALASPNWPSKTTNIFNVSYDE